MRMLQWNTDLVYSAFPQLPNNRLSHHHSNISPGDTETLGRSYCFVCENKIIKFVILFL